MGKPKVGVIGAGYWGKNIVRALWELGALGGICDSGPGVLDPFREKYPGVRLFNGMDDLLSDGGIDAVAVALPAEAHEAAVRAALLSGKDVFVEKPLCLSEEEGEGLVGLASGTGRVLMVGHLLHYHGAVRKLKEMVDGGMLGKLYYIHSARLNLGLIRGAENALWSLAPHDISLILRLVGEAPCGVDATAGNFLRPNISDAVSISLGFPSGARAHVFASWLHPFKEQRLAVAGSGGMAVFTDTEPKDKLLYYPHRINWKNGMPVPEKKEPEAVPYEATEPLKEELSHFMGCVEGRKAPLTDGAEGLRVLRTLQACQSSMDAKGTKASMGETKKAVKYFAHPTAVVEEPAEIGEGTSVWHFSHIMREAVVGRGCNIGQNVVVSSGARVGDMCKIQNNVSVYAGVVLEDGVFCGPSMVFTNVMNPRSFISRKKEYRETVVRKGATLGANCTVVCGNTVGRYAFVGAGAVVTKDVPDHALVAGNPAKVIGWMCECGVKLGFQSDSAACEACGAAYKKTNGKVSRGGPE